MVDLQDYNAFLATKAPRAEAVGFDVEESAINPMLFDWQRDIARWAIKQGRAALFMECGLGKGPIQLEWSHHCSGQTSKPALVVAPLAVARQMLKEGDKFGYWCEYVRNQEPVDLINRVVIVTKLFKIVVCAIFRKPFTPWTSGYRNDLPIIVTNYEMLKHFDSSRFGSLSIDESSILKNYTGATKRLIFKFREPIKYLLAPTATPAPNDHLELGNHAEFLKVMPSDEMISRYFVNDSMQAGGYRLKGHAADDFWDFVASWAVCISQPPDERFVLPPLRIEERSVAIDHTRAHEQGRLFIDAQLNSTSMWAEKRATIFDRCQAVADVVLSEPDEYWIVWYDMEDEAELLHGMLPGSSLVMGKHSNDVKERLLDAFSDGKTKIIITHRKIAGLGLNWQHCARMTMFGTYSFEGVYQGLRRSWRFGQTREVVAYIITAESEYGILETLKEKQAAHAEMQAAMDRAMARNGLYVSASIDFNVLDTYQDVERGRGWKLYLGDCIVWMQRLIESGCKFDFSIFSPPFALLYIYSALIQDLGNCADLDEFFKHYSFVAELLSKLMKDGSKVAIHCKDLPLYQNRDGEMGLYDFPGDLVRAHEAHGLHLVEWITIWKDPVIEMQRTKNAGLLWSSAFCERAERCRQGMADYVLVFERTDTPKPINHHSPLVKSVIDRCIDLWSNSGERIISPFIHDSGEEQAGLIICDQKPDGYTRAWIKETMDSLMDGRDLVTHICDARQMIPLIMLMSEYRMVFHSRVFLTDGTWLVVFRKWVDPMPADSHVTHDLEAPYYRKATAVKRINQDGIVVETVAGLPGRKNPNGHVYVGTDGPRQYDSDRDYSIQVWQRYASPVWYDLDGLPKSHKSAWMKINQTNVLNAKIARDNQDEKHICPLQLDLIAKCLEEYTRPGDMVFSPFAGVGSEGYESIKAGRQFVGIELKQSYWKQGVKFLQEAEQMAGQIDMFQWAGIELSA